MNKLKFELKYLINRFSWLGILNAPFKPFKVGFYAGKIAIGVPYFFPRKWVKGNNKLITAAVTSEIAAQKKYNALNPQYARKIKSFEELFEEKKNYNFAVPLKVGFSYCGLGWKTKWNDKDYRFEWNPVLSFVFFGYQIAITIYSPYHDHYWTSWLYYKNHTDKTKSKRERIEQCKKEFGQKWVRSKDGKDEVVDYYECILKRKYITNEL
jgi:hypothetical protein